MADRGIIFSAPMVRALLDGRKTQTRRYLKAPNEMGLSYVVPIDEPPAPGWFGDEEGEVCFSAGFKVGDRLWVRETWAVASIYDGMKPREINPTGIPRYCGIRYAATDERLGIRDRLSRHMPRWASRIWLEVTDVRVQRLQDISEDDAWAEGLEHHPRGGTGAYIMFGDLQIGSTTAVGCYSELWRCLHKPGERWADNPWIVAVSFKVHRENIDKPAPRCAHGEPLEGGQCAPCEKEDLEASL